MIGRPQSAMRQHRAPIEKRDVEKVLSRIREYRNAGLGDEITRALEDHIHPDTIESYLADASKAVKGYKIRKVVELVGSLPPARLFGKKKAYDFAVKEMRIKPESQASLLAFAGVYDIAHDFRNSTQAALSEVQIHASDVLPGIYFLLKYTTPSTEQQKGCDGLVLTRGGHILLTGLSRHGSFFASVGIVSNPQSTPLIGGAIFEDVDQRNISFSKIALVRRTSVPNTTILEKADKIVAGTYVHL